MTLYAHTTENADKTDWQTLSDHLKSVSTLAASFSEPFHAVSWGKTLGLLHDIGKGSDAFQRRLTGSPAMVDHSSAGAKIVWETYGKPLPTGEVAPEGLILAAAIAGHHGGMPNVSGASGRLTPLLERLYKPLEPYDSALKLIDLPKEDSRPLFQLAKECSSIDERLFSCYTLSKLLFSALVDADWLDTERVMNPEMSRLRRMSWPSMADYLSSLDSYMTKTFGSVPDTKMNQARAYVQERCQDASDAPTGIFTLEVPTGGGKTLASCEFALRHAIKNGQNRIIYAIPFTSIVEQNAHVFKDIFGEELVLEHHSNYDFGFSEGMTDEASKRSTQERLLVQNWDAPFIVTTNVQLFESLFSNKTSRSRKVHNIANSVIVLDEAQTLPDGLLKPTLAMLESLSAIANVSVVLCTATQPAFDEVWPFKSIPTKIIPDAGRLSDDLGHRCSIDVSRIGDAACSIDEIVSMVEKEDQALCIVSSRRAAGMLFQRLVDDDVEGIYHLSALMVPEHRMQVLETVRERLREGKTCKVISTQLIEAGVDVDFPVVFREMTGIDSILQAAGRCNREGKRQDQGRVVVFDCFDFSSGKSMGRNWLQEMKAIGEETIQDASRHGYGPFGQRGIRFFFEARYIRGDLGNGLDSHNILKGLTGNEGRQALSKGLISYETISDEYKFISDEGVDLFVPWGEKGERLLDQLEAGHFSPQLYSSLQRYSISVPWWLYQEYLGMGAIRMLRDNFAALETRAGARILYDPERGLLAPDEGKLDSIIY